MKIVTCIIILCVCNVFNQEENKNEDLDNSKELRILDTDDYYSTPKNDWGKGSIFFLDRHDVDCKTNKLLNNFFLMGGGLINYGYYCVSNSEITNQLINKQTRWDSTDENDRKSIHYLDRHTVDCGEGYGLQRFKLERNEENLKQIRYNYRCAKVSNYSLNKCKDVQTSEQSGDLSNQILTNIRTSTPNNIYIQKFKMNSRDTPSYLSGKYLKYMYRICSF